MDRPPAPAAEETLDLLGSLRSTPPEDRRSRLARLSHGMLVELAARLLDRSDDAERGRR